MTLDDYQDRALRTDMVKENGLIYAALKLNGEAGEIAEVIGKSIRPGNKLDFDKLAYECGDLLWYLAKIVHEMGFTLTDIAELNLTKLALREKEGTLLRRGT